MEVISIKIPKTGSESFGKVLFDLYGQEELVNFIRGMKFNPQIHNPSSYIYHSDDPVTPFQEELKEFKPLHTQVFVHNHVPVDFFKGYYDDTPRIAFLREPISWVISSYWFTKTLQHIPQGMDIWDYIEIDYRKNWVSMLLGGSISNFNWIGFQETWWDSVREFLEKFTDKTITVLWNDPKWTRNVQTDGAYIRFRIEMLQDKSFARRFKSLHKDDIRLYKAAREEYGYGI